MKVVIVSGSPRPDSQTRRIADVLAQELGELERDVDVEIIDLHQTHLPLWQPDASPHKDGQAAAWAPISTKLAAADAFVIMTPEYHGQASPQIKNLLFLIGKEALRKPALLVSVSAGMGGAYPISDLRVSAFKNIRMWVMPDHLIFRKARSLFNDPDDEQSQSLRLRARRTLKLLCDTADAMAPVLAANEDMLEYGNGM